MTIAMARMRFPMLWVMGLLLLVLLGRVLAQEESEGSGELEARPEVEAYEQVITRFNTNIKAFASWDALKAEVLPRVSADTVGSCYELTGKAMQPVEVTAVRFDMGGDADWRQTSEGGWRHRKKNRRFIEYRFNEKANVLLRVEGVKPRFFFATTKRICEFPM